MIHSVDYDAIVSWLLEKNLPVEIPTLGRRSHILVSVRNEQIQVHGSGGATTTFSRDYWSTICQIIDGIDVGRREITTYYTSRDVPNYMFAPSVPAICRQYCDEHRNNQ